MLSLKETNELSKIHSWTLKEAMLSFTFINSHSQVIYPGPKGPLVDRLIVVHIFQFQ